MLVVPLEAYALNFGQVVDKLLAIFDKLVIALIALAVIGFFWGIVKYIFSAGKPDEKAEGTKYMIYGIISIFVMISFWGLVAILQYTIFGTGSTSIQAIPQL